MVLGSGVGWRRLSSASVGGSTVPSRRRWSSALGSFRMKSLAASGREGDFVMGMRVPEMLRLVLRVGDGPELAWAELPAVAAVEHVHRQPDNQPHEKSQPGQDGQARHQQHTKHYAEDWRRQAARSAESATPLRLLVAQDDDADRHQDKREQRTDVRQIRERANVENPA